MSDNELIIQLQNSILNAVNLSQMPIMVKDLVIENVLLKLNAAVKDEAEKQAKPAQEQVETKDEQAEKE